MMRIIIKNTHPEYNDFKMMCNKHRRINDTYRYFSRHSDNADRLIFSHRTDDVTQEIINLMDSSESNIIELTNEQARPVLHHFEPEVITIQGH